MATDGELVSLMSHTLGSIGQVVKQVSTLREKYTDEEALKEVERIYNGYVKAISKITGQ
jgi:hypothetical protein